MLLVYIKATNKYTYTRVKCILSQSDILTKNELTSSASDYLGCTVAIIIVFRVLKFTVHPYGWCHELKIVTDICIHERKTVIQKK